MNGTIAAAIGVGILALGFAGPAAAQEGEDDGIEVTRGAEDLQGLAATAVDDQARVDTALVFSDLGGIETRVACRATGADGALVGSAFTRIPAGGLRVILASDLSAGAAFAGRVRCRAGGHVHGKALLVAPAGLAQVGNGRAYPRRGVDGVLEFPLVATR